MRGDRQLVRRGERQELPGVLPGVRGDAACVGQARSGASGVVASHPVTTAIGTRPAIDRAGKLPARAWQRISAGPGAKGPRWYDWALIEVTDPAVTEGGGPHWLLIRRRISDGEYAFHRAHAPRPVPLGPAGPRGRIAVENRGRVRRRKGTGCPGRAPGPQLDVLAPVDRPGPARRPAALAAVSEMSGKGKAALVLLVFLSHSRR